MRPSPPRVTVLLCLLPSILPLTAEVTPFDQPLVEEREIAIACELTAPGSNANVPVVEAAKEAIAADGWRRLEESHRGAAPAKIAADCRNFVKR